MSRNWFFEDAKTNFNKYKESWQQLGKEILQCNHPLLHVDYVQPLLKYFAPKNTILALKGASGKDGMVLLNQKCWGIWESFVPGTGPFSFALIKNDQQGSANSSIASLLSSLPGYAFLFTFHKLDPDFLTVKSSNDKGIIEKIKYIETIKIPIDRSFEDYWKARSKNLKRNIIKKVNRIEKSGMKLSFHELKTTDKIKAGVETYGRMESAGWKGKNNSAVHIENHRGAFYVEMLKRFALREKASIYQLLFDNKVVASALTIKGCNMAIILKITFDEDMKDYSPGLIMMYELHKKLFSTIGINNIEHYGKATQRAKQWADNIRTTYHLNCYRSSSIYKMIKIMRNIRKITHC